MKKSRCRNCKVLLNKDEISINRKLLSRRLDRFFCVKCLADYLETTKELLKEKIEDFKSDGCELFK